MNQLAFPRTTFTIAHDIATQQKKYELTVDVDGEPVAEGEADHRNVESLKHEKVSQVAVCVCQTILSHSLNYSIVRVIDRCLYLDTGFLKDFKVGSPHGSNQLCLKLIIELPFFWRIDQLTKV